MSSKDHHVTHDHGHKPPSHFITKSHKTKSHKKKQYPPMHARKFQLGEKAISNIKEALETNVMEPENKGFKMLVKMGFDTSQGLGKDGQGIREPIKIDMNLSMTKNSGIGSEVPSVAPKSIKEIKESEEITMLTQKRTAEEDKKLEEDYINRMKWRYKQSRTEKTEDSKFSEYGDDFDDFL